MAPIPARRYQPHKQRRREAASRLLPEQYGDSAGSRGPQHAGKGSQNKPLCSAGLTEFGVAAETFHSQYYSQSLRPTSQQGNVDACPLQDADPSTPSKDRLLLSFLPGLRV